MAPRKSELDADDAGVEVRVLQKKMNTLEEESSQLRKSLTHLQGELDQQQRLNHALAQRNVSYKLIFMFLDAVMASERSFSL